LLVVQAQQKLAAACGLSSLGELASLYAAPLLKEMLQRSEEWTHSHPDVPAFLSLVQVVPGAVWEQLGELLCLAVGSITKDHDRDAPLRVALLRAVDDLLENNDQGPCLCAHHGLSVFTMVLLPSLVWRAGAWLVRHCFLVAACHTFLCRRLEIPMLSQIK
jgi:hypothetical protein